MTKPEKYRVADFSCENCDFEEECIFGPNINAARQRVIRHHQKTGHTVTLCIQTIYTYKEG